MSKRYAVGSKEISIAGEPVSCAESHDSVPWGNFVADSRAFMPAGKTPQGRHMCVCVYRQLGPGTPRVNTVTVPLNSLACGGVPAFCFCLGGSYTGSVGVGGSGVASSWSGQEESVQFFECECSRGLALLCGWPIGRPRTSFGSGSDVVVPGIISRGKVFDVLR